MDESGEFEKITIKGLAENLSGKSYLDAVESMIRQGLTDKGKEQNQKALDFMWYFWCGAKSPLFGKDKTATFERYFIEDKKPHKETKNPYYIHTEKYPACYKIFEEFGLCNASSHIINGHTPVKEKDGESPIRAGGKLLVIDGGFAKSYRKETGRAGYTLTYNSYGLVLYANEAFESVEEVIREEKDVKYDVMINEKVFVRKRVYDTDKGKELLEQIEDLKILFDAYRDGTLQEKV